MHGRLTDGGHQFTGSGLLATERWLSEYIGGLNRLETNRSKRGLARARRVNRYSRRTVQALLEAKYRYALDSSSVWTELRRSVTR